MYPGSHLNPQISLNCIGVRDEADIRTGLVYLVEMTPGAREKGRN